MKRILAILTVVLTISSCSVTDEDISFDPKDLLSGNWTFEYSNNGETVFKRTNTLPNEKYGVSFFRDGKFIERTSGWCGTPPLVFSDVQGTYQLEKTLIKVNIEGFPGNYHWRIISLTNKELVITYDRVDQETDLQELMDLFNEIYVMATSESCQDANDWSFTAYGSKACGGPQGYLAYPNSINVNLFLEKVAAYTQKEKEYNIKWDVISTCDLPAQPTGVKCENDLPVLTY
jgi:hypothetical protein